MRLIYQRIISGRTVVAAAVLLCLYFQVAAGTAKASNTLSTRALRSMARVNIAFGRYEKAQTFAQQALSQAKKENRQDDELAMCYIDLGTVYQNQDRLQSACEMLEKGIEIQKNLPEENPYIAYTIRMLGSIYRRQQQYQKAQQILDEAIEIMLITNQPGNPALTLFHTEQAKLLTETGQLEKANEIYTNAIEIIKETYGNEHLCTANVLEDAARLDLKRNRFDDAKTRIETTIRIRQKYFGNDHRSLVSAWLTKAQVARAMGDIIDSEKNIRNALNAAQKIDNPVALATLHRNVEQIRSDGQLAKLL